MGITPVGSIVGVLRQIKIPIKAFKWYPVFSADLHQMTKMTSAAGGSPQPWARAGCVAMQWAVVIRWQNHYFFMELMDLLFLQGFVLFFTRSLSLYQVKFSLFLHSSLVSKYLQHGQMGWQTETPPLTQLGTKFPVAQPKAESVGRTSFWMPSDHGPDLFYVNCTIFEIPY